METPIEERSALVTQRAVPATPTGDGPAAARPVPLRSGWLPAAAVILLATAILAGYGVPVGTTVIFLAYLAGCVVLPGTLVWRAVDGNMRWFGAELAAGTAVGYAGEVVCYIVARSVGVPLLVLAWPVGVVAAFVAVPGLRRHLRGGPLVERPPAWFSWALAAAAAATVLWSVKFFRWYGLTWPGYSNVDTDSPFHLALVGEAKHHLPMEVPWLAGEPLHYHWFVYAEMAATSWVTGIEPQVLLLRLAMLPMLAGFAVLTAALAIRLLRAWWTGIAAAGLTLFVLAPNPYGWTLSTLYTNLAFGVVDDGSALRLTTWTGPTQTFGALLFLPVVLLLVRLLQGPAGARPWALFIFLLACMPGAKATYVPLLLAALLVVAAYQAVASRRVPRAALGALAVTAVVAGLGQAIVFGGVSQGLTLAPLKNFNLFGIATNGLLVEPRRSSVAAVVVITAFCWAACWAGVSGLGRRRRTLDAPVVLLLGIAVAGAGATLLFGHSGDSQRYFFEGARPYLSVAAVVGLAAVLDLGRHRRSRVLILAGALVAGVGTVLVVRHLDGPTMPAPVPLPDALLIRDQRQFLYEIGWPYAALVAVTVAVAVLLLLARRRSEVFRGVSHAAVIVLLAGMGLAASLQHAGQLLREGTAEGWHDVRRPVVDGLMAEPIVTEGTAEAGRWLRAHSRPDDVVATNAHCLPAKYPTCVNLHFAVAAYTERRVLVEGWGFTQPAHIEAARTGTWVGFVPYWDPARLAANDAVFTEPTVENATVIRDRYHVRWLVVDESEPFSGDLSKVAGFRFRSGRTAVYELNGTSRT